MEERQIFHSSYPTPQVSLDNISGLGRPGARPPLTDSTNNSQNHGYFSIDLYHDSKEFIQRPQGPMYLKSTVPSVPSHQPLAQTWEQRRNRNRRRKRQRYIRNPIVDSPHYQAYRARQNHDGNPDDQKWPEILELAFLDGICWPQNGI
jgi:transcriptional enhancer factor